jgi:hypothetical protein
MSDVHRAPAGGHDPADWDPRAAEHEWQQRLRLPASVVSGA